MSVRLVVAAALVVLAGCVGRQPSEPKMVGGVAYGTTHHPFRYRWWHFYERGVSWSAGGFWGEAEADLRACLRLRQSDDRHAWTHGMHFTQCFAHRELGAVLIEEGKLDEAERELRQSMAEEPSAKAQALLQRIDTLRHPLVGAPPAVAVLPDRHDAVADAGPAAERNLVVERIEPQAGGARWRGRFTSADGAPLWILGGDGARRPIPLAADGAFDALLPAGGKLATSAPSPAAAVAAGSPVVVLTPSVPAEAVPRLEIDGVEDGAQMPAGRRWLRWRAASSTPLRGLTVEDGAGATLANVDLAGVAAGGMLALELAEGERHLLFRLRAVGGDATLERRVTVHPAATQDRALRAVAVLLPLQEPKVGQPMRPEDDARLSQDLVRDGRFRFVDQRADALRTAELARVEAGWVDERTAVRAGERLHARYVVAGTIGRGHGDVECFLRLIHCASGRVVASADAYAVVPDAAAEERFFTAVAGRLRQVFPVLAGSAGVHGDEAVIDLGAAAGVVGLMRFHLLDAAQRPTALVEVDDVARDHASGKVLSGAPRPGPAVSE